MNRLGTITQNNKRNRVRDLIFAAFIALSAAIAVTALAEDLTTQLSQR